MKENANKQSSEYISIALDKAISDIYAEHPHECNMVIYIGGAILFSIGA